MTIGILGRKLGMTQLFKEDGTWVPVTVIQAGPCKVMQVKTKTTDELPEANRVAFDNRGKKGGKTQRPRRSDGYYAVQLGFDPIDDKHATKAEKGHGQKAGGGAMRFVREFRYKKSPELKQGDDVKVGCLKDVKLVDVIGITKGRGFMGTIVRWNFSRQPMSHGNSKHHRKPGGLGRTFSISKGVPKGKHMAGHYGVERVTVQSLDVVQVDEARNLLYVGGAIPGARNGYVIVRRSPKNDVIKKAPPVSTKGKQKK